MKTLQTNTARKNCHIDALPSATFRLLIVGLIGASVFACSMVPAFAITRTWNGGTSSFWGDGSNWSPAGIPQNGDDLVFNNSPGASLTNNLSNLSVRSIRFNHSGAVYGNDLTATFVIEALSVDSGPLALNFGILKLGGSLTISENDTTGWGLTLNCQVNLNGHDLSVGSGNSSAGVNLQNCIFGTGNLSFTMGNNYMANYGFNPNTFNGTVSVTGGTLSLGGPEQPAIPGNLYIGLGATASATADNVISSGATVEIYSGGYFLLNGRGATISSLVMSNFPGDAVGCRVDTGSGGILGINGSVTANNDSVSVVPTISGRLACNGFTPIGTYGAAGTALYIPAEVLGDGFAKLGASRLAIQGSNSFSGGVEVDEGVLSVENGGAFAASSGVALYGSGIMSLYSMISGVPLDVQGNYQGTLETRGSVILGEGGGWAGPIVLHTNLIVEGATLTLNGVISGSGGLDVYSSGTVVLGGTSANTFTGTTRARSPLLELAKPANVRALNGPLIVGGGASPVCEVRWLNNYQDYYNALYTPSFTVYENGFLNLNNNIEVLGPITFNGGWLNSGASGLASIAQPVTVNPGAQSAMISGQLNLQGTYTNAFFIVGDGLADCDLLVNAVIQGSPGYLVKQGPGKMCLSGNNTYDAVTLLQQGTIEANGGTSLGSAAGTVISLGATLRLNGGGGSSFAMAEGIELAGTGVGGSHGAIEVVNSSTFTITGPLLLDADTTIKVDAGSRLTLQDSIASVSGATAPLTLTGGGTLQFAGSSGNSFSGDTIVRQGTLELNKPDSVTAVPGTLYIGSADGSTIGTGRNFNNYQIISSIVVYPNSTYDINNFQENAGYVQLWGNAAVTTGNGGGLSMLPGAYLDVYSSTINGPATISGIIELGPGNQPFYVASNAMLVVNAAVNQYGTTASLQKTGPGVLQLNADNGFGGNVNVTDGTLIASQSGALGASSQTTTVSNNAALVLAGGKTFNLETLILNSSNSVALQSSGGSNTWKGPIGLYQPTTINVPSSYLQVLNSVSGPGGLIKSGAGTLQFWGGFPNNYFGGTTVAQGTLEAGRVNQVSIPGDVSIGDDTTSSTTATLQIDREQQFSAAADVTVHKSGLLQLNSNPILGVPTPTIATLSGLGNLSLGPTNASLTVNNSAPCTFPGQISGAGKFIKNGPAKMGLTGNNSFTGNTIINGGALRVDGSQLQSPVQINAGKLQGTGTVGLVDMNGNGAVVEPGDSPGILNCGNLNPDGTGGGYLNFQLNGLTPGTGYDQLYVLGNVNLTGLTLAGSLGFASAQSNSFTIIQNDGTEPITGTFVGLPQNATTTIGWQQFRISYTGGDGNDVVLTQISSNAIPSCDPAPSGLLAWWPGAGNAYDIIGRNNGTLQNGATSVPGKVGQAFFFDGVDDRVVIPNFCSLLPTNEVTVEFWQKVGSVRSQFNFCPATLNGNNIFDVSGPWGDGVFYWEFGNANTHAGQLAYTPTNSIIGTWQHFACVASQSGNYMKIYRNGILEAQKTGMTPFARTNQDFVLGGDAVHPYDGQLDEVSIYNRALSAAEIQAIYDTGTMGKCLNSVYITSINRSGTNVSLTWLSQPGVTYRIQSTDDINPTAWSDATSIDIIGSQSTTSAVLPASSAQKFYRIVILK